MKKILLTAALILAFARLQAEHQLSDLHLRLFDNTNFIVVLDGYSYQASNEFTLTGVEPGVHQLTVIKTAYRRNHGRNRFNEQVIFRGHVDLPASSMIHAEIDRNFRFRIRNAVPICPPPPVCNLPAPGYHGHQFCAGMHPETFAFLKQSMIHRSFDSSKLGIAMQALEVNDITAAQLAELMALMTFDSYKLDLAKFAYSKVVDKQNFWMVNDEFTFESSIRDLNYFISRG